MDTRDEHVRQNGDGAPDGSRRTATSKQPPATLVDAALRAAATRSAATAYRFLSDGETETATLTYAELDLRARRTAVALREECAAGDRVLLLFEPGLAFVSAFMGVLYAGLVATPAAPPGAAGASAAMLAGIVGDAGPRVILHDGSTPAELAPGVPRLHADDVLSRDPYAWSAPALAAEDLAFLQYTSGSTGSPKGVMVSHGNLIANQAAIAEAFGTGADDVIVSWLPFHHDMGLIGGILHTLYLGATGVLMPPAAFVRRPLRWLSAISRFGGTISPAPNFAYDLCARTADARAVRGLDLSRWRVACNGSEPVRGDTLRRFASVFAPAGFDLRAFAPSYGMAEATLLVSSVFHDEAPATDWLDTGDGRPCEVVSCGRPPAGSVVAVRGGRVLPDGEEGELCVTGPGVAAGYWGDRERSEAAFGLRLAGRPHLRTGDLGYLRGGAVHVTGRIKDVLIVRGRNHHPADIEATVQALGSRGYRGRRRRRSRRWQVRPAHLVLARFGGAGRGPSADGVTHLLGTDTPSQDSVELFTPKTSEADVPRPHSGGMRNRNLPHHSPVTHGPLIPHHSQREPAQKVNSIVSNLQNKLTPLHAGVDPARVDGF